MRTGWLMVSGWIAGAVFAASLAAAEPGADAAGAVAGKSALQMTEVTISLEKQMPSNTAEADGKKNGNGAEFDDPFKDETPVYAPINDPYEKFNRAMFSVNDWLFDYFLDPVATGIEKVVPERVRLSIKNLFANAASPAQLFSSMVQGDVDKTVRVLGRLVVNTTVGLGGLFDVASYYEIDSVNEDFGQTLASYDVPAGPYLVLPFFGPLSSRDLAGRVVDSFLSPTIAFAPSFIVGAGITVSDKVNATTFQKEDYKDFRANAVDPYVSMRDFYHQYREGQHRK